MRQRTSGSSGTETTETTAELKVDHADAFAGSAAVRLRAIPRSMDVHRSFSPVSFRSAAAHCFLSGGSSVAGSTGVQDESIV